MYSTLKPTNRFTRNSRCPCSNDCDDHGDFFSRHKAGPPDEPRVDGRWCNVQHQEHMTVQSSCTQNNTWIRHLRLLRYQCLFLHPHGDLGMTRTLFVLEKELRHHSPHYSHDLPVNVWNCPSPVRYSVWLRGSRLVRFGPLHYVGKDEPSRGLS